MMASSSGYESMESESYQMGNPTKGMRNDFMSHRPIFVRATLLLTRYFCAICMNILIEPHQTPCGNRVCKKCIYEKIGTESSIRCTLLHDDLDESELAEEDCQKFGLKKDNISPDHSVFNSLMKERCFCTNQRYGCKETPMWKKLQDHEEHCAYTPVRCFNPGCGEMFADCERESHERNCAFTIVKCSYCSLPFQRRHIEEHYGECDYAETQCQICKKSFGKRKHLVVHQRIHAECLTSAGECYYHHYCGFKSDNIEELRSHLANNANEHLECVTVKFHDIEQLSTRAGDKNAKSVKEVIHKKIFPLEKVTAEISMDVKRLRTKLDASETNGDHLVNAMRTVANSSQQIETVQSKVAVIERQIKDSGLDRVTVIESHSQMLKRHAETINEMEKRLRHAELASYDGTLIWKISNYKSRKSDAVRGRQMSIYSHPFYTNKFGYKMCCRAYLNGDGLGRGKCLSLFFVVMRGEYDDLLCFPFKQRVTFSLLCPSNPSLSKHETFLPDPDSSSFRKPQTDMNIASGCPQFAMHSEVESSTHLVNDSIYIRVRVEQGGDVIP